MKPIAKPPMMILPPLTASSAAARATASPACAASRDSGEAAGLQYFGAGRALWILQVTVLLHDERAAQRNHHQDSNQSAENRDQHDARDLEIESENHDRRHGYAETEGD